jgi:hypothetical protein
VKNYELVCVKLTQTWQNTRIKKMSLYRKVSIVKAQQYNSEDSPTFELFVKENGGSVGFFPNFASVLYLGVTDVLNIRNSEWLVVSDVFATVVKNDDFKRAYSKM